MPEDYRNMSAREREERIPFLLARDGNVCSKRFGDGCGKSIQQLIHEAEFRAAETGIERTLPVITVDHVNGDSHQNEGNQGEWCGNLQILCWSCNRKKIKVRMVSSSESMTREKRDSIQIDDKFFKNLQSYLVAYSHICYKEMLAVGKKWAGGVQITIGRHFETELKTDPNPTGKFRFFPYECLSPICNGNHVCFAGDIPKVIIDKKIKEYEEEWQREYAGQATDEEWKQKFGFAYRDHPYVDKDGYVKNKIEQYLKSKT